MIGLQEMLLQTPGDRLLLLPAWQQDLEICGPSPVPPLPVSQGKRASASSVWHDPGYEPDKAFDGDSATRWAAANGQHDGWLEVDLGHPASVSRAVIQEISWPSISKFSIEARDANGTWQPFTTGTTIGAYLEMKFAPITAQYFRLHIESASNMPNIEEFQLFEQ
ncbi:MAG: discoidin domain-containing protein [Verrucomicrobia bacterium]|nr:discoidin domain-containing protein [Verrucomicrobiota bacterium]